MSETIKKGSVPIDLFLDLNNSIGEYVKLFEKKHGLSFDFWAADMVGTVACFSDYYIDFEDIRLDLEKDAPKGLFLEWYDITLDAHLSKERIINYYSYLKGFRPK